MAERVERKSKKVRKAAVEVIDEVIEPVNIPERQDTIASSLARLRAIMSNTTEGTEGIKCNDLLAQSDGLSSPYLGWDFDERTDTN